MFFSGSSYYFCQASWHGSNFVSSTMLWVVIFIYKVPMSSSIEPAFSTQGVLVFSLIRAFKLFAEQRKRGILLNLYEENWRKSNNRNRTGR